MKKKNPTKKESNVQTLHLQPTNLPIWGGYGVCMSNVQMFVMYTYTCQLQGYKWLIMAFTKKNPESQKSNLALSLFRSPTLIFIIARLLLAWNWNYYNVYYVLVVARVHVMTHKWHFVVKVKLHSYMWLQW